MKVVEGPIVVSREFANSPDEVWAAITNLEEMHHWYFDNIPAFEARVGFKTEFPVDAGERIFMHTWEVIAVEPGKMIRYTWKYPKYEGFAHVTFEIEPQDTGVKLTVSCTVLEDFQDDIPEFTRESCQGGWNYFIGDSLTKYLNKEA